MRALQLLSAFVLCLSLSKSMSAQNSSFGFNGASSTVITMNELAYVIEMDGLMIEVTIEELLKLAEINRQYSFVKVVKKKKKKPFWKDLKKIIIVGGLDTGVRIFQKRVLKMENPPGLLFVRISF